jgi:hypothetical protein
LPFEAVRTIPTRPKKSVEKTEIIEEVHKQNGTVLKHTSGSRVATI